MLSCVVQTITLTKVAYSSTNIYHKSIQDALLSGGVTDPTSHAHASTALLLPLAEN
jgi:hypothetical protein